LKTRRSKEDRMKNHVVTIQKQIQQYIKDGSRGDLGLSNTPITSLPDGLVVGRSLYLRNTPITTLPVGLVVGGRLYLNSTQITALPTDLKVGGDLDLTGTPITTLPVGLKIGGSLDLSGTPISKKYTNEELKEMLPGVDGNIYA
jgi:hypothetical protein